MTTDAVLADHTARLGLLEERLAGLRRTSARHSARLSAAEEASRNDRTTLQTLTGDVEALTGQKKPAKGYQPEPPMPWWELSADQRAQAIVRLHDWVERIYKPMYGHLARLGDCWPEHPLCVLTLDWLAETWKMLYLAPERNAQVLASMADFGTRILPAAAGILAREITGSCHFEEARGITP